MRRPLIVGNWKMFGKRADLKRVDAVAAVADKCSSEIVVCPPATLIGLAVERAKGTALVIGAQNIRSGVEGPFTGDICADMVADLGARYCIVGHSERRSEHAESDSVVAEKARWAAKAGLVPIVCVGETLDRHHAGEAEDFVRHQVSASLPEELPKGLTIAYEPVWAIGSGLTPTADDIAGIHECIRARLRQLFGRRSAETVRILYGGSVRAHNAAGILSIPYVDGALVGGASLDPSDFATIVNACPERTP